MEQLLVQQELLRTRQDGKGLRIQTRHQVLVEIGPKPFADTVFGDAEVVGMEAHDLIAVLLCPKSRIDDRVHQALHHLRPAVQQRTAHRPDAGIGVARVLAQIDDRSGADARFQFSDPGQPGKQGIGAALLEDRCLLHGRVGKQIRSLQGTSRLQALRGHIDKGVLDPYQLDVVDRQATGFEGVQQARASHVPSATRV